MKNLRLILLSLAAGFIITGCNDNKNEQKGPEYSYAITFEGAQLLTGAGEYEPKYDNILWGEPKKELTSWGDNVYDGIFYTEQGASFCTYYNDYKSGGSPGDWWGGFALSSNIGMEEASSAGDYSTQFGVYASTASKFAVGYDTSYEYSTATYDKPTILFSAPQELVSARFANANKTYYYCKNNPEEVKTCILNS